MTLSSSTRYQKYSPVVLTDTFIVPFPIFSTADLRVVVDSADTVDFSVNATFTDGRSSDAEIVLNTAVTGVDVEIYGRRTPRRDNEYLASSPSLSKNLQFDADVLTAVQQEQKRDFDRTVKVSAGLGVQPEITDLIDGTALVYDDASKTIGPGPTVAAIMAAEQYAAAANPYASRAAAVAATVPELVNRIDVAQPSGKSLAYVRDASGTALSTNGGTVNWSPDGDVYPDHWAENTTPGVSDMSAALQAAIDYSDDVLFFSASYLLLSTVFVTANRKRLRGGASTILKVEVPSGEGLWYRNGTDHTAPGALGPGSLEIEKVVIWRGTGDGASVRLTRTTGIEFRNVDFWGGAPDVLGEGAMQTTYINCTNTPLNDYSSARKPASIEHRWFQYSDLSFERGYSTKFFGGSFSTSIGTSYRYDSTVLITAADVFEFHGTYFGSSLADVLVKPDEATINIGSLNFFNVFFDDGGADVRYDNEGVVLSTQATTPGIIRKVGFSGCTMHGLFDAVQIFENPAAIIEGVDLTGCRFLNGGRRFINAVSTHATKNIEIKIVGGSMSGIGIEDKGDPQSMVYGQNIRSVTVDAVDIHGGGAFLTTFLSASGNGIDMVSIGRNNQITDFTDTELIGNAALIDRLSVDQIWNGSIWLPSDLSGETYALSTTPATVFDASEPGSSWSFFMVSSDGTVGASVEVLGGAAPVIVRQDSAGSTSVTFSVSGTNIQAVLGAGTRNLFGRARRNA